MTPTVIKNTILGALSGIGAFIATALGGWDMALQALLAVMVIDIITGLMVAGVWKKSGKTETGAIDSHAMQKGLCRKFVMILIVYGSFLIDKSTGMSGILRTGVILFFTGNEGISIVENAGLMGVPMPAIIKNAFEQLRAKGEKKDEPKDDDEVK